MRRFALFLAMCGLWAAGAVAAGPFDQLSSRLKQYDDSPAQATRSQGRPDASAPQSDAEEVSGMPAGNVWQESFDDGLPWDEPCDGCCGGCGRGCGFYGRAEYLHWWVRGSNTPALVTTSPDNTPIASAGVLPTATVLFGDQRVNTTGRSGGRFTAGYWLDPYGTVAFESTSLFLGNVDQKFSQSSGGSPILARPFFNVQSGLQDADLIAFPNSVIGTINVANTSRVVGTELNLRRKLYTDCCHRLDILAGYRFLQLSEGLQVNTNTTSVDTQSTIPVGTIFSIADRFATNNNFHGGQLGLHMQYFEGPWMFDVLGKVALGGVGQHVTINGNTVVMVPGQAPASSPGGILALASNSGGFNRSQFAVLPELDVNLHYQLNHLWRINVGYSLLFLSNVVRPGDQIDTRLDPNQFPPPIASGTFPRFVFNDSDVWIQGINVGVECNF